MYSTGTKRRIEDIYGEKKMTIMDIIILIVVWFLISMIAVFVPSTVGLDDYCDENGIIWVSKNRIFNK